jgi:hypothetical protein
MGGGADSYAIGFMMQKHHICSFCAEKKEHEEERERGAEQGGKHGPQKNPKNSQKSP